MIVVIISGKLGSIAGYKSSGEIVYDSCPSTPRGMVKLLKRWGANTPSEVTCTFVDEYFMINSQRLEVGNVDVAGFAHHIGMLSGVAYALTEYVIPIDAREELLKDHGIVDGYDIGSSMESIAFDVASKAFPDTKQEIEDRCELFFSFAPALAVLSKILKSQVVMPSVHSSTSYFNSPDSNIYC